jgi:hypothetical protein
LRSDSKRLGRKKSRYGILRAQGPERGRLVLLKGLRTANRTLTIELQKLGHQSEDPAAAKDDDDMFLPEDVELPGAEDSNISPAVKELMRK